MLEGITLLNQSWVYPDGWTFLGIFGVLGAVVFGLFTILLSTDYYEFNWKCFIGFLLCAVLAFCGWTQRDNSKYPQYQVTISDSINFNEFTEKYNVISQEGKIYTISEKKEN